MEVVAKDLGTLPERFAEKYEPEPMSGCWLWTAKTSGFGHGGIFFNRQGLKEICAHRASWLLFRGDIPEGMQVLHRCDVPQCVNPAHLFLGTQLDNMRDCRTKGRGPNWDHTHCANGHLMDESNTRLYPWRGVVRRYCKKCQSRYQRDYQRRKRARKALA